MAHPLPAFDPTAVHDWQDTLYAPSLTPPPPSSPKGLYLRTLDGQYSRLIPSSEALILIAPFVGLPTLSLDKLPEWMVRLWSLHDLGYYTEWVNTADGPAGLTLTSPALLLRHLHLAFPGLTPISCSQFDQFVRSRRLAVAYAAIPEVPCQPPPPPTSPSPFPPPPS